MQNTFINNMKEKLNAVREAVIKAVPGIMELKFGCHIKVNLSEGGGEIATAIGKTPHLVHWTWAEHHENKGSFVGTEMDDRIIILGRPIRLADVLLAIRLCRHEVTFDFQIEPQNFAICCDTLEEDTRVVFWNLHKDDLSLQSEETIDFLYSLIIK